MLDKLNGTGIIVRPRKQKREKTIVRNPPVAGKLTAAERARRKRLKAKGAALAPTPRTLAAVAREEARRKKASAKFNARLGKIVKSERGEDARTIGTMMRAEARRRTAAEAYDLFGPREGRSFSVVLAELKAANAWLYGFDWVGEAHKRRRAVGEARRGAAEARMRKEAERDHVLADRHRFASTSEDVVEAREAGYMARSARSELRPRSADGLSIAEFEKLSGFTVREALSAKAVAGAAAQENVPEIDAAWNAQLAAAVGKAKQWTIEHERIKRIRAARRRWNRERRERAGQYVQQTAGTAHLDTISTPAEIKAAYLDGSKSYLAGTAENACPYGDWRKTHSAWRVGWHEERERQARWKEAAE